MNSGKLLFLLQFLLSQRITDIEILCIITIKLIRLLVFFSTGNNDLIVPCVCKRLGRNGKSTRSCYFGLRCYWRQIDWSGLVAYARVLPTAFAVRLLLLVGGMGLSRRWERKALKYLDQAVFFYIFHQNHFLMFQVELRLPMTQCIITALNVKILPRNFFTTVKDFFIWKILLKLSAVLTVMSQY